MARPKAARFFEGVQLEDNLYPAQRKTPGLWRWRHPVTRKDHGFEAPTVDAANRIAREANANPDGVVTDAAKKVYPRNTLGDFMQDWVENHEAENPRKAIRSKWKQEKSALGKLVEHFATTPAAKVTTPELIEYFRGLDANPQRNCRTIFKRFTSALMMAGRLPEVQHNPFIPAAAGGVPYKELPAKVRQRMTGSQFWEIHAAAGVLGYGFLQDALEISLYTTLRKDDVVSMLWDAVQGGWLKVQVRKSTAMHGVDRGVRLEWELDNHELLAGVLERAGERAAANGNCPYVISHDFLNRIPSEKKTHHCQVLARYLDDCLFEARQAVPSIGCMPVEEQPTFHEVRALAGKQLKHEAGYDAKLVSQVLAHSGQEGPAITRRYTDDGHKDIYHTVDVIYPLALVEHYRDDEPLPKMKHGEPVKASQAA